jgi:hypothetical protein
MKVVLCLFACLTIVAARPQEGAQFANEAIKQATAQRLIPGDAIIQGVSTLTSIQLSVNFIILSLSIG